MIYVIKFKEEQLSFLFNCMEPSSRWSDDYKGHAWYKEMESVCWNDETQEFVLNPVILNKEQRDVFYQDMVIDSELILKEIALDVRYHTCNDSSFLNSKWCLEMISDIIDVIKHASETM